MQHGNPSHRYLFDVQTDKYFRVNVYTDSTEVTDSPWEKSIDEVLNLKKYKCHICNIEVPESYAIEHNNSAKHKTCVKIANIALERTTHQMQLNIAACRKIEVLDTYFCEPCAAVVLNSGKETHEASKVHKISLKHDKLLSDLLKIYEDNENIEEISETDDLELLKQAIEQESLQESVLQDTVQLSEKVRDIEIVEEFSKVDELKLLESFRMEQDMVVKSRLQDSDKLSNKDIKNVETTTETDCLEAKMLNQVLGQLYFKKPGLRNTDKLSEKTEDTKNCDENSKINNFELKQDSPLQPKSQNTDTLKKKPEDIEKVIDTKEIQEEVFDAFISHFDSAVGGQYLVAKEFIERVKVKNTTCAGQKDAKPTKIDVSDKGELESVMEIQKKTIDALESEIDSAFNRELFTLATEIANTAAANKNSGVSKEKMNELKNIKLYPIPIDEFKRRIEHVGSQPVVPRNAKHQKRALKKMLIAKKKERTNNIAVVEKSDKDIFEDIKIHNISLTTGKVFSDLYKIGPQVNEHVQPNRNNRILRDDISSDVVLKVIRPENIDSYNLVEKQANNINTNEPYNKLTSDIDKIMSKYVENSCTVDTINNNVKKEQNNNKTCNKETPKQKDKETMKNKSNRAHNIEEKQNDHQNRNIEKAVNKIDTSIIINTEINETNIPNDKNREENKRNPEQNKNDKSTDVNKKHDIENQAISTQSKPKIPHLAMYLRDISRRCEIKPIHTVEALTPMIVQITAINGAKFKVLANNFHSFHVKSEDIYCKVCETPNVKRPEWHMLESEHRAKVMTPIKDLNGIRQLDDTRSHCILCNNITEDLDFHLQSLHHMMKIKQTVVHDSSDDGTPKNPKKQTKKNAALSELVTKNNLTMTTEGYLTCTICEIAVDDDLASITQHINSFHHLHEFQLSVSANKVMRTEGDKFFCIACDIQLAKSDVVAHCNGKRHSKLLQEYLIKQEGTADVPENRLLTSVGQNIKKLSKDNTEPSGLVCFVCNIIIHSIDDHTNTFCHKKSYLSYLESNKLNEIKPDIFSCIPCNTVITIDYFMAHCMSKKHQHKLKCLLAKSKHKTDCNAFNNQKQNNKNLDVHNEHGLQDNTDRNVINEHGQQDNTDSNVINGHGQQDNTDSNVINEHGQQDNTDSNVINEHGQQDNTDSNVINEHGQQDNTDSNVINEHGQQDNTDSNVINEHGQQDNTDSNVINGHGQQDNTDSNVINEHGQQDNTDSNVINEHGQQDNTDSNVINKHGQQDNTNGHVGHKQAHEDNTNCNEQSQINNSNCNVCNEQGQNNNTNGNVCNELGHQDNSKCIVRYRDVEAKSQPSASLSHPIGNNHSTDMPLKVLYQFQEIKSSNKLLCTICDEEVKYTRKSATYHVRTLNHIIAFNVTMLWNKIKKGHDKYFCDICMTDITYFSEICHVWGKEHSDNLSKLRKGTVFDYDRALLTHAYAMSHKVGNRVRPRPIIVRPLESSKQHL